MKLNVIDYVVGLVIALSVLSALAPTIFAGVANINETSGAPAWLNPILVILTAVAILYAVMRFVKK